MQKRHAIFNIISRSVGKNLTEFIIVGIGIYLAILNLVAKIWTILTHIQTKNTLQMLLNIRLEQTDLLLPLWVKPMKKKNLKMEKQGLLCILNHSLHHSRLPFFHFKRIWVRKQKTFIDFCQKNLCVTMMKRVQLERDIVVKMKSELLSA